MAPALSAKASAPSVSNSLSFDCRSTQLVSSFRLRPNCSTSHTVNSLTSLRYYAPTICLQHIGAIEMRRDWYWKMKRQYGQLLVVHTWDVWLARSQSSLCFCSFFVFFINSSRSRRMLLRCGRCATSSKKPIFHFAWHDTTCPIVSRHNASSLFQQGTRRSSGDGTSTYSMLWKYRPEYKAA